MTQYVYMCGCVLVCVGMCVWVHVCVCMCMPMCLRVRSNCIDGTKLKPMVIFKKHFWMDENSGQTLETYASGHYQEILRS